MSPKPKKSLKPKPSARNKPKKKLKPSRKPKVTRPVHMRHDTPVDLPALSITVFDPRASAANALARVRRIETISGAYDAWIELRLEHSGALLRLSEERKQLEQQGEFLVGAVRAARDLKQQPSVPEALALARTTDGLDAFVVDAAARLEAAKASLEERSHAAAEAFGHAFAKLRAEVKGRIQRTLHHVRPQLKLMIRPISPEKRILHLARLTPEEAVLLAWVLLERLPSRYDYLFDDSTDDVHLPPPTLFAEEGISKQNIRPTVAQLQALLVEPGEVVPIKGVLPFFVPQTDAPPQLARLVQRGPVMEAELADDQGFRNVLSRDEAERIAGYFLRLKLENRLEIELSHG